MFSRDSISWGAALKEYLEEENKGTHRGNDDYREGGRQHVAGNREQTKNSSENPRTRTCKTYKSPPSPAIISKSLETRAYKTHKRPEDHPPSLKEMWTDPHKERFYFPKRYEEDR